MPQKQEVRTQRVSTEEDKVSFEEYIRDLSQEPLFLTDGKK
jgi:hypothetical protein